MNKYEIVFQDGSAKVIKADDYKNNHGFINFVRNNKSAGDDEPLVKENSVGIINAGTVKGVYLLNE